MKNWKWLGGVALVLLFLLPGCGTLPPEPTEAPVVSTPVPVSPAPSMAPIPAPEQSGAGSIESVSPQETALAETQPKEVSGVLPGGIYTRRYEEYTDELIPADDYGPLVPYLGDNSGPYLEDGLWGLATLKGELVTDPVFTQVWRGGSTVQLPYLLMQKPDPDPEYRPAGWVNGEYDFGMAHDNLWAMAALDGSWCTGFRYRVYRELTNWGIGGVGGTCQCDEKGLFVRDAFDDSLVYLSGETGEELLRVDLPIDDAMVSWRDGMLLGHYMDENNQFVGVAINTETGQRLYGENILFRGFGEGLLIAYDRGCWREGYADMDGNWVLPAVYGSAGAFQNGKALVNLRDEEGYSLGDAVIDREGNILLQDTDLEGYGNMLWNMTSWWDEELGDIRHRIERLYDAETLQPVDSPLTGQEFERDFTWDWDHYWNEEFEFYLTEEGEFCWERPESKPLGSHDYVTGELYTSERNGDGSIAFCRPDGTLILEFTPPDEDDYVTLAGGMLLISGEEEPYARVHEGEVAQYTPLPDSCYTGIMTPDGEWVFRYPYQAPPESVKNE